MFGNLLAEIKRTGLSQKEFAKKINMNEINFSRKINSKVDFKYDEIIRIIEFFDSKLSFDYLFEETDLKREGLSA